MSYQEAKEKGTVNAGPNQPAINANSFFTVIPFVKKLRKWIRMKKRELETEGKQLVAPAAATNGEKRPRSSSYNYSKNGNKPASPVKQASTNASTPSGSSEFKPVYKTIHSIEEEMLSRSSSNITKGSDTGTDGEKKNPFLSFKIDMAPLMKCFDSQKVK